MSGQVTAGQGDSIGQGTNRVGLLGWTIPNDGRGILPIRTCGMDNYSVRMSLSVKGYK
jgi:hypothetical protein